MKFILTTSIKKSELKPVERVFSLEVMKLAAKKVLDGLGKDIKSSVRIPASSLKKLYLTSTGGAGRALFLLRIDVNKVALVMTRLKNDKKVGANMTIKNPYFKEALEKNLFLLISDVENGDFEEFEL